MAYVVDDSDELNLELIIALVSLKNDLPITASLFNENIAPHLRASNPKIRILNPAKIAAPKFVEALYVPLKHYLKYSPAKIDSEHAKSYDPLMWVLSVSFTVLIAAAVTYFHFADELSWLNSLYFVVVTVATVGYGDINLLNSSPLSKLINIGLIVGSTFFIWLIFSLTIDRIIKKRLQRSLGIKQYSYKNHIILCGLGRLGYFIGEKLIEKGEKLIIIEKNENSPILEHFRNLGVSVYIGDARLPKVLENVAVQNAKALFSVVNNDYANLEIGLNARSFKPDLRLILRIFDESMSEKIKENLDIHLALSTSAIADNEFFDTLNKTKSA